MKLARFRLKDEIKWGIVEDETIYSLDGDIFGDFERGETLCGLEDVQLLAPCKPRAGIACGRNYLDHIKEMGWPVPEEPNIFFKPLHTVIGTGEPVIYPSISTDLRCEAELCVVMKKNARNLSEEEALDYVLGYTCGNDVTAIDWFFKTEGYDLVRTKGCDTCGPLGPWLETDVDPNSLTIRGKVNGEIRQESHTSHMLFSVQALLHDITSFMTLYQGDVLWTGTPGGGASPVEVGDIMEVEIEGIGTLRNELKAPD